ncbi:hypothetical protein DP42_979 [Burkholderia pseudomallei]|nr:hypothetical protein BG19_196 [Burkholderia pseudomallei MSHR840]KGC27084.1 hypothetical protein DO73_1029 [Burkholderia pseudomallei]KGD12297.1 hypothetical protein DP42_979 [Burkholderia pseudomallei]KGD47923.1 hypothetical protein DP43_1012 [Burkholderia pseudomallei]
MFALGFYWLATRHRATRPRAQTLPPAARRSAFVPRDIDEWESGAPYPDHILKAVREMERGRQGASSPSDTRHEALQPDRTRDARTQLHEGIDALTAEPPLPRHRQRNRPRQCHPVPAVSRRVSTHATAPARLAARSAASSAQRAVSPWHSPVQKRRRWPASSPVRPAPSSGVSPARSSPRSLAAPRRARSAPLSESRSIASSCLATSAALVVTCLARRIDSVPSLAIAARPTSRTHADCCETCRHSIPPAQPCADIPLSWNQPMLPISPLEYLAAFTLAFLGGARVAACHCRYVGKVRRDTWTRAYEVPVHA